MSVSEIYYLNNKYPMIQNLFFDCLYEKKIYFSIFEHDYLITNT